tara:strand:- start:310 stop:747 length:438 start_codon:yes stop_codon:yes gene_type:complete
MTKSELLNELYKKYGLDKEDTFRSPQGWTIITRAGIDKIQAQANIDITYDCIEYTPGVSAAVKASADWNERKLETYGEANEKNCRQSYVLAMAEKRAMSRIALKLTGFYALGAFGEDESENFKRPKIKVQEEVEVSEENHITKTL